MTQRTRCSPPAKRQYSSVSRCDRSNSGSNPARCRLAAHRADIAASANPQWPRWPSAVGYPPPKNANKEVADLKDALRGLLVLARNIGVGGTDPALRAAEVLGEAA